MDTEILIRKTSKAGGSRVFQRPFLPLLLLFLYVYLPGIGLWLMSFSDGGVFGIVDPQLVSSYLIHATVMFVLAWYLSGWRIRSRLLNIPTELGVANPRRGVVLVMMLATGILFALGGVNILFLGEDRGELRTSLGLAGFFYTWLQIYLAPFVISVMAGFHVRLGRNVRGAALMTYALGLVIGVMSGYKFTTILIFLPALTLAIRATHWKSLIFVSIGMMAVLMLTETMQSGRPPLEALAYLFARATSVAAYGVMGAWSEFSQSGPSLMRFVESGSLLFGSKFAAWLNGVPEDSIAFLRFNLSRYITYLYYPNADGAVNGTVNLTLTVFGEAVAMLGGTMYWLWSLFAGVVVGFVLRKYSLAHARGDVLLASWWLVYYFSVVLSWINSSGWIVIISLPVVMGMTALRLAVIRRILVRPVCSLR